MGSNKDIVGRIAIVSCGPTGRLYDPSWRGVRYDIIIGCRSVAARVELDYWCIADWKPLAEIEPLGSPAVVVRSSVLEKVGRHAPWATSRVDAYPRVEITDGSAPGVPEGVAPWWTWSGTMALGMAWRLRARQVDLYGMDLGGIMDSDGREDAPNRTEHRWAWEKRTVEALIEALRARGAVVEFASDRRAGTA